MRLSASQIQTFVDCQRKWAWRYVAGIEEPPNAAAELGRSVHAALEKYLNGGQLDFTDDVGYIAAAGLEYLPKPGTPGLLIEQEFHFEGPSGHTYLGFKDLEQIGIVYDHKTTSDLKWQKSSEDLKTDIQATLYAVDYFRNHPEDPDVELRWVYYQTKNTKKSAVTSLRVNQTETWNRFLDIEKIAETMAAVSTTQPLELPPTVSHCRAYGGCPHQGRCNLSPFEKMRAYMEQNKLLLSLQAKKNGTAPPAEPVSSVSNKLLARLQAGGAPAASAPVPAAINPPEYQPPPVVPGVSASAPALPRAFQPGGAYADTSAAVPLSVAQASAELSQSLSTPAALADTVPKAGRGRPKKAALPATGLAVKIETLYLNCGPMTGAVVDATQLVVLAKKRLAEGGLADYRFAEYGQGPGMLAVAVAAELDALEGMLSAVRLDTTTPEGAVVAVELMARAGLVVR